LLVLFPSSALFREVEGRASTETLFIAFSPDPRLPATTEARPSVRELGGIASLSKDGRKTRRAWTLKDEGVEGPPVDEWVGCEWPASVNLNMD
jgi:hypothetical protein